MDESEDRMHSELQYVIATGRVSKSQRETWNVKHYILSLSYLQICGGISFQTSVIVPATCSFLEGAGSKKKNQNSFFLFFATGFGFCLAFFPGTICLVFATVGTRTCHFAWYLLHFGMVTWQFASYLLHLAMFAFHFDWNLIGICHILALQPLIWMVFATFVYFKNSCVFLRVSSGFQVGLHWRSDLGGPLGCHLGLLGVHWGFHLGCLEV